MCCLSLWFLLSVLDNLLLLLVVLFVVLLLDGLLLFVESLPFS